MAIVFRQAQLVPIFAELDWDTAGFSTGVQIGSLPQNWNVMQAFVRIQTTFNAGGTDLLNIGYTAGGGDFCVNLDISGATGTVIDLPTVWTAATPLSANRNIFARYAQTGAAATAGKLYIVLNGVVQ